MPLTENSKLGPYEIKTTLGAGGMGEVYRSRDSRLNRDVAIKVLRGERTASPEHRSRFEREARAVAALNHPNIVAVYDFGIEGDQQYIVSELIDGESLRSLLHGKPVPVRKLVDIATQVADGLAAAHAAGVVHRDLKPENIMLGRDGRVKILDFGLARHSDVMPESDSGSNPTVSSAGSSDGPGNLTQAGAVMGTFKYMSPEQALGKVVTYRSDQFSFGLILHEMASGKQAFIKASSVETMAAIVREEPPPIDEKLPAPLTWIIDRCLHKEPDQRYESTRDLYRELRNLRDHFSAAYTSGSFAPVIARQKTRRWVLPFAIAGCLVLVATGAYLSVPRGQNIENYRYTPFAINAAGAVWSRDGKAVAYAAQVDDVAQVSLRYLDSSVPIRLTHEKSDVWPIGWASDGNHLIVVSTAESPGASPTLFLITKDWR